MKKFIVLWLIGLIATLAFWGVIAWAVIELVQWLTSK